ncbi:MAG: CoA transferase [candidate division NC10 bacterium]|nr:CoA transferase [candidate division NC10 bacterium]
MAHLLDGVTVLDLTRMLAGPYGSLLLADLGAEVIKVEDPAGGDPVRAMGPPFLNGESAYFISINRNKKSLTLDLTTPRGREVFLRLVQRADVVLDNFRPGILEKLGVEYPALRQVNPRIIACSISAFGQDGPYRSLPAFDLILQAMGGAMSITGEPNRDPVRMGLPMGDLAGGLFGAFAVAGALFQRERTGEGRYIDLSLLDCQVSLLTYVAQYFLVTGEVPGPVGSAHASAVPYQAFRTQDRHIVIAVFTEKFWSKLCAVIARPDLVEDPRFATNAQRHAHRHELVPILEEVFASRPADDWLAALRAEGIPSGPINSVDRVLSDPQVLHRGMMVEMEHPRCGRVQVVNTPVKVIPGSPQVIRPSPALGQDTEEVLRRAGYTVEEIAQLRRERII